MLIKIKVKTNCKKSFVEKVAKDEFRIEVKSKPEEGAANSEALAILSKFLGIEKKRLKIIKGSRVKNKIVKTLGEE